MPADSEGITICGYANSPGTIVATQAWSLHRDDRIFEDAEGFKPERWLESDKERLVVMNKQFVPFGVGARGCVGQKCVRFRFFPSTLVMLRISGLAMVNMRLIVAALVRSFDISLAKETTDASMACEEHFMLGALSSLFCSWTLNRRRPAPVSHQCKLHF